MNITLDILCFSIIIAFSAEITIIPILYISM